MHRKIKIFGRINNSRELKKNMWKSNNAYFGEINR